MLISEVTGSDMDQAVDEIVRFKLGRGDVVSFQVGDSKLRGQVIEQLDAFFEKYQPELHAYRCKDHPDKSPLSVKVEEAEGIVIGEFCPWCFERWITQRAFGPNYGKILAGLFGFPEDVP